MYKTIEQCRCCGNNYLTKYLDLGLQPLANSYHKGGHLEQIPLDVNFCSRCFHSQLSVAVNPILMFKNYLYVSSTTKTFKEHCRDLAIDAKSRFPSYKKLSVCDIACNDGLLLECFRDLKCDVFGVDPAENLRKLTKSKNIEVIVDYWGTKIAGRINQKFDIITAVNVFAHVNDLKNFLHGVKISLAKDGLLIVEFPYCKELISRNEFDTIYHEHLSYFLVNSAAAIINHCGFYITDVLQTSIHGGSIRIFCKAIENENNKNCQKVQNLIVEEQQHNLYDLQTYLQFADRIKNNKLTMHNLLTKFKSDNYKIVGYGASAKGNTMLNYFGLDLDYIVDDNKLKWGYLTPGRNIPIISPLELKKENKLAIVILSWNFYKEIQRNILDIRGPNNNDYCILYVPNIEKDKV